MTIASVQGGSVVYGGASGVTNGTTTFTDATQNFTPPGANFAGNNITIKGAGPSGADLQTTIASVTNATTIVLNTATTSNTTGVAYAFGTGGPISSNWTTSLAVTLPTGQQAGDLICLGANDNPANSDPTYADTAANVYTQRGSTISNADYHQTTFTAPVSRTMAAATNTLTVTFGGALNSSFSEIFFRHFSNVGAFGQVAQGNASSASVTTGNFANSVPEGSLIWCMTGVNSSVSAAGAGYTAGSTRNDLGDIEEYQIVHPAGTYAGTATQASSGVFLVTAVTFLPGAGPTVRIQQRAPGFPSSAPLPGVARLTQGILNAAQPVAAAALIAVLAGTGALTANLTGSGALTDEMDAVGALTASIAGAGALSCTMGGVGALTASGITVLANVGSLSTQQRAPGFPLSAPLPGVSQLGVGILKAGGAVPGPLTCEMDAVGALTANLTGAGALTDTMNGVGALTANLTGAGALTDTMNGVGALTANLTGAGALTDTMNGVGALTANLTGAGALTDTMNGVGALIATPSGAGALTCEMDAVGALTATPSGAGALTCEMDAVGALNANISSFGPAIPILTNRRPPGFPRNAPLPGIVRLGTGILQMPPIPPSGSMTCNMTGIGAMTATPSGAGALTCEMDAVGTLNATPAGAGALGATLAGVGALTATPQGAGALVATLTGVGALTATPQGAGALTLTTAAVGALSGPLLGTVSATMAGTGAFIGVVTGAGALNATLAGIGALTATLSGAGLTHNLTGIAAIIFLPAVNRPHKQNVLGQFDTNTVQWDTFTP